jgi:DnaJ family protein A protein 5
LSRLTRKPSHRIRKAYRRKALELHPDRNINDVEASTQKFALVQTAYEILSDPQERAWYDSHRDAILAGQDDVGGSDGPAEHYNMHLTSAEEIFTLMGRFSSSVPMDDSPRGFFGILDAFFDQLAAEERAACEWEGQELPLDYYPPFGSAQDDYDSVARPFYAIWSGFATRKPFSWKDKYRLSDAPDRQIRRLMEKENKKLREEGVRTFNDAVRSLVAFVKKRDPRYVPNTQSEADRQKFLRDSAAAQAARSRAANQERLAAFVVPEWAQSREDDEAVNDEFLESSEESEVEHIVCVVCNKTFKSEKQFEAHEKSKKHVKAVQQLRRQMKRENADFDLDEPAVDRQKAPVAQNYAEDDGDDTDAADGEAEEEAKPAAAEDSPRSEEGGEAVEASQEISTDDEYAPRSAVEDRMGGKQNPAREEEDAADPLLSGVEDLSLQTGEAQANDSKKMGKAKAKRAKKAAREQEGAPDPKLTCGVCKEVFSSRTRLFDHIEEEGHAVPIVSSQNAKSGKKGKRKK